MARADAMGMFWFDEPKVKAAPKEKIKREKPFEFWKERNYLPGLAEALRFDVPLFTDAELVIAQAKGERLVWDIESYPNYFLIAFKSVNSGKVICFETDGDMLCLDLPKLKWVLEKFCIVSFNGIHYDAPLASLACSGREVDELFYATERIIKYDERPADVLKALKVKHLELNHIDLKEVAPLHDSLKIYAGRLHVKQMRDLPFEPGTILDSNQKPIVKHYCVNDLNSTELLYNELLPAIQLREAMSAEYKVDLRSKSDAQVAEAVIMSGLRQFQKGRFKKPEINYGARFKYNVPHYIKFQTPLLNWVLDNVRNHDFVIGMDGAVDKSLALKLKFTIANGNYTMGIGGLHSTEKSVTTRAGEDWLLLDRDVSSFYPMVILAQGLFPAHLGQQFLRVYRTIVERRLAAKNQAANLKKMYKGKEMPEDVKKKVKDLTLVADSLKITINGSFGKFGNAYSMLYSPHLMIQVTLTGQLVLLMLIERLELAGINVISANTDGVVIKCHKSRKEELDAIVKQWESDIGAETEETPYKLIANRDVNNYFAVKPDGEIKVKGVYAEKGSAGNSVLSKNPYALIASDAVKEFITKGTPINHTIRNCKDIRRFVCIRHVKGGAVKVYNKFDENLTAEEKIKVVNEKGGYEFVEGYWLLPGESDRQARSLDVIYKQCAGVDADEYLGKAIRWYYSNTVGGEIVYAKNGNKVSMTDGARPLMTLPDEMPNDINYEWYEQKANEILEEIAY